MANCPYCQASVDEGAARCARCNRAIGGDEVEIDELAARMQEGGMDAARARRLAATGVAMRYHGTAALDIAADSVTTRIAVMELIAPYLERKLLTPGAPFESLRQYMSAEDRAELERLIGDAPIDGYVHS